MRRRWVCDLNTASRRRPAHAPNHVQSTIVLYTKLDAECDQHVTVVGRLLTTLDRVYRRPKYCQRQIDNCRLFVSLGDGGHAVAKFLSQRYGTKFQREQTCFWRYQIFLILCKKQRHLFSRLDTIPASDRQTDRGP